jgi:hypothetical protein
LPKYLISSPNNILLQEVKAVYPLVDPLVFSSEITREYLQKDSIFYQYQIIKELFMINNSKFLSSFSISNAFDYFYFYYFNTNFNLKLSKNFDLYKSQYRPLKKGITNMVRLHATGAIAMPSEIRLHILASSKDVIHS